MPFLAPIAGAAIGALFGRKGRKKSSQALESLTGQQAEASKFALGEAKQTLGQAREALQDPLDFYRTLLGGDRTALTETLAPEIGTVVGQFDTARKNIAQFAPRGGGRSAALGESQFKIADIITNLLAKSRRDAAGQVAAIGGQLGALGASELASAGGIAGSTINSLLLKRKQDIAAQTQLGTGIGKLLAQILGSFGGGAGGTFPETGDGG